MEIYDRFLQDRGTAGLENEELSAIYIDDEEKP